MRSLILILFSLLLITACASQTVCPDGTVVANAEDCPSFQEAQEQVEDLQERADELPTAPTETTPPESETEPPVVTPPAKSLDPEIQELLDKMAKVKSYRFGYAPTEFSSGQMVTVQQNVYNVKGDKVRVDLLEPMLLDPQVFYDTVFYSDTESPRAFCMSDREAICPVEGSEREEDVSGYRITLPEEWTNRIPPDATMRNGPSFFNRQTSLVEYVEGDQYYQLYLDNFYGMPMAVKIYAGAEHEELVGGAEFQDMKFNMVEDSYVTRP